MPENPARRDPQTTDPGEGRRARAARLSARRAPGQGRPLLEPHFSQPVRQVVLMLIVLALVGTGAWFAYGRILPIFAANPLLNGAILLVFALGVLTCFWQVAQLVKSVSWIERFAASHAGPALVGEPATDVPPRLLAPLAAMLGARGPALGAISTESARSIQDSVATRIDEARDITRYLANLLIFLGLLGTFYGLATTVPAIVETIRTLAPDQGQSGVEVFDKLMHGLETQLGGMATAFSSSLLGLAGSLVVGLLELFASHGQNRFYRELEEWLSSFTRIGFAGGEGGLDQAALVEFLDGFGARLDGLQAYYADRDLLRDEEAADADARSIALADQVSRLVELLGSDRDRLTVQLLAEREATTEAQSRLLSVLDRIAQGQEALAGTVGRSDPALLDGLQRLAEGQERLAAPPAADPALLKGLKQLSAGHDRLAAGILQLATPARDAGLEGLTQGLEQALARLAEGQERLAELVAQAPGSDLPGDMRQALAGIADSQNRLAQLAERPTGETDPTQMAALNRALSRLAEGQNRLVELAETRVTPQDDPEARMRLRSIDVQLGRLLEEAASDRDGLISELREDLAALTRAIRALEAMSTGATGMGGRHGA
ncbi:hypothetical protein GL279_14165 [Paracoccus limosus]|uniref:Biopolymer transporter ExbB n=1 Tax=Paracoccus limosus TaxID=913252 RepID=A0A844HAL1_9RHOB|nr:hypothetical protein [Paracoccus limosus]